MKCLVCGALMKAKRENFRYDACGLPQVTLKQVEVSRCPNCGEYEVTIDHIEALHKAIADVLIRKPARFNAAEIKFLRKYLGWSGVDFADHIGTTRETVSRWEHGTQPIGAASDRLLRLMVATQQPVKDYSLDTLKSIGAETTSCPVLLARKRDSEEWYAQAA